MKIELTPNTFRAQIRSNVNQEVYPTVSMPTSMTLSEQIPVGYKVRVVEVFPKLPVEISFVRMIRTSGSREVKLKIRARDRQFKIHVDDIIAEVEFKLIKRGSGNGK